METDGRHEAISNVIERFTWLEDELRQLQPHDMVSEALHATTALPSLALDWSEGVPDAKDALTRAVERAAAISLGAVCQSQELSSPTPETILALIDASTVRTPVPDRIPGEPVWNRVANVVVCAGELIDFNHLTETRGFGALILLNSFIELLVALHAEGYAPA